MAELLNKVILGGNLTKSPETKEVGNGKTVCQFTIAVDKRGKDAGTNFIDCVAWELTAKYVSQYLDKGSKAIIVGRLDQQTWVGKDGANRSKLIAIADEVKGLNPINKSEPMKKQEVDEFMAQAEAINPDDIPF